MNESQITFNEELELEAPSCGVLKSIRVRVTIEPKDAGALIYGYTSADSITAAKFRGGPTKFDLPFIEPYVWIKHLHGLRTIRVDTLGFTISR